MEELHRSDRVDRTIKKGKKGLARVVFSRTALLGLLLLLQLLGLWAVFAWLQVYVAYVYTIFIVIEFFFVVYLINRDSNPAFQISWMVLILLVPVVGTLFYIFVQRQVGARKLQARLRENIRETRPWLQQQPDVMEMMEEETSESLGLVRYMNQSGGYPIYRNTDAVYFPLGEAYFAELLRQLETAEKFIFMEFFIVDEGHMWEAVLEILKRIVMEWVEV
ncbi:MAG: PLDc N-terminal domain-containing protein, partial [Lachnospiraceae bacterium]|nr:PLDc N-terminal domain-containing protein [Lachnospiraceae bacterium]